MWCSDHLMYGLIFIAEPIRLFDIPDCRLVRKPVDSVYKRSLVT